MSSSVASRSRLRTVVHVVPGLATGGAERALVHLAAAQLRAGLAVHVVALRRSGPVAADLERVGARVTAPPDARRLVPGDVTRLVQELRSSRRADATDDLVVHAHLFAADVAALPLARAARAAAVTTLHGVVESYPFELSVGPFARAARRTAPALYRRFDATVAVSEAVRASFHAFAGVDSIVVPNAVSLTAPRADEVTAARAALQLPPGARALVALGRLVDVKRVDLAVRALRLLPDAAHLIVVGDGPARAELERLAQSLGVQARTRFVGERADPQTFLALADVVVITSPHEGFPLVAVEALQLGACVAATRSDGLGEVLAGSPAPAIAALAPEAVAASIAACLGDDVNQRARAWATGRAAALACTPERVHARLFDVYVAALRRVAERR